MIAWIGLKIMIMKIPLERKSKFKDVLLIRDMGLHHHKNGQTKFPEINGCQFHSINYKSKKPRKSSPKKIAFRNSRLKRGSSFRNLRLQNK